MNAELHITSGNGPLEVREFVALLQQQAVARCRDHGVGIANSWFFGDALTPASVTIAFTGNANGLFAHWVGTHALLAASKHRGRGNRKRWFAGVSLAEPIRALPAEIASREVRFTHCRAGGPGGQHVNTTSSAVHAHHLPSGIHIKVTQERSQHANRRLALIRIAEILATQHATAAAKQRGDRRAEHWEVVRGNPVISWVIGHRGMLVQK